MPSSPVAPSPAAVLAALVIGGTATSALAACESRHDALLDRVARQRAFVGACAPSARPVRPSLIVPTQPVPISGAASPGPSASSTPAAAPASAAPAGQPPSPVAPAPVAATPTASAR